MCYTVGMNVLKILSECGFTFNKRFGQNFLTDTNLLHAVVADAGIGDNDDVIEVGVGAGTLTRAIAAAARSVIGYEIDRSLEPVLERTLADCPNATIRFADVMCVDDGALCPVGAYKVVANLPYYITTPVLFRFVESQHPPVSMTLTVQKEVADRLSAAAGAPEYGAVTAALGLDYRVRTTRTISRKLFTPEPNVDSAVVRLDHAPQCENAAAVRKLIRSAFSMRRKTLVNNLSGAGYKKPDIVAALEKLSFPADVRGERLSPTDYIRLYHLLTNTPAPV